MKKQITVLHIVAGILFVFLTASYCLSTFRNLQGGHPLTYAALSVLTGLFCLMFAIGLFTDMGGFVSIAGIFGIIQSLANPIVTYSNYEFLPGTPIAQLLILVAPLVISALGGIIKNGLVLVAGLARRASMVLCIIYAVMTLIGAVSSVISIYSSIQMISWSLLLNNAAMAVAVILGGIAMQHKKAPAAAPAEPAAEI